MNAMFGDQIILAQGPTEYRPFRSTVSNNGEKVDGVINGAILPLGTSILYFDGWTALAYYDAEAYPGDGSVNSVMWCRGTLTFGDMIVKARSQGMRVEAIARPLLE